jgi:type IV pilus assembly protein PilC
MKIDNIDMAYSAKPKEIGRVDRKEWTGIFQGKNKKTKFKDARKEVLFSELHSLLTSGIDFNKAFTLVIRNEKDAGSKRLFRQIHEEVIAGSALWESLSRKKEFSNLDCGVIRIGEETGKISESLFFLSDYYNKKIAQRRMITSAVSYPVMVLFTAIVVFIFMIMVIVPLFVDVYTRTGGELPGITASVMAFSENFHYYLFVFCIIGIGLFLLFNHKQKNETIRKFRAKIILNTPYIGHMVSLHYQSNFCKLLFLLYSSGVPLLHSIEMLADIITFYPYSKSFTSMAKGICNGGSFSDNVAKFPHLYDNRLVTLLQVGEETNNLSAMLEKYGKELSVRLEYKIKQIGSIMEPLLILFIGILVATILISMYLPMFRLGTVIQ